MRTYTSLQIHERACAHTHMLQNVISVLLFPPGLLFFFSLCFASIWLVVFFSPFLFPCFTLCCSARKRFARLFSSCLALNQKRMSTWCDTQKNTPYYTLRSKKREPTQFFPVRFCSVVFLIRSLVVIVPPPPASVRRSSELLFFLPVFPPLHM